MHRLLVLYAPPNNSQSFREHYEDVHVPLVKQLPGLMAFRYSLEVGSLGSEAPSYFCVAELDYRSSAEMLASLESPEGQASAADLEKFASGGVTILHYEVNDNRT